MALEYTGSIAFVVPSPLALLFCGCTSAGEGLPACFAARLVGHPGPGLMRVWAAQVRLKSLKRRARLMYLPAYVANYVFGEQVLLSTAALVQPPFAHSSPHMHGRAATRVRWCLAPFLW